MEKVTSAHAQRWSLIQNYEEMDKEGQYAH